jgi:hypothetical protein
MSASASSFCRTEPSWSRHYAADAFAIKVVRKGTKNVTRSLTYAALSQLYCVSVSRMLNAIRCTHGTFSNRSKRDAVQRDARLRLVDAARELRERCRREWRDGLGGRVERLEEIDAGLQSEFLSRTIPPM